MPRTFDPKPVLAMPLMAMLATVTGDGAPRNAPVWFLWEDGALWMPSSATASSARRVRHDPRVSVEIVHFDNAEGVLLHVGLRGAAECVAMQPDRFRRLLAKYLGPDEAAWNPWFMDNVAQLDDPDGRLIRLAPDSVFTNNVSYFRTGPALAWP